jgi:general stress protein YciG
MQTLEGGKKIVEKMTEKHGSYEAWCEWMRSNGAKGGKWTGVKGFALMTPERRRELGAKGGTLSRRNRK